LTAPDGYDDRTMVALVQRGPQGKFQRNFTVNFDDTNGRDLAKLLHEAEAQLLQMRAPGFRLGAKANIRISGREAATLDYVTNEQTPLGPLRLVRRLVILPLGERVFFGTFTALEAEFAQYVGELDAMIASIKL